MVSNPHVKNNNNFLFFFLYVLKVKAIVDLMRTMYHLDHKTLEDGFIKSRAETVRTVWQQPTWQRGAAEQLQDGQKLKKPRSILHYCVAEKTGERK